MCRFFLPKFFWGRQLNYTCRSCWLLLTCHCLILGACQFIGGRSGRVVIEKNDDILQRGKIVWTWPPWCLPSIQFAWRGRTERCTLAIVVSILQPPPWVIVGRRWGRGGGHGEVWSALKMFQTWWSVGAGPRCCYTVMVGASGAVSLLAGYIFSGLLVSICSSFCRLYSQPSFLRPLIAFVSG